MTVYTLYKMYKYLDGAESFLRS